MIADQSGAFKARASGRESGKERVRRAKCGKHEDAGRKAGRRAVGDQQRDGLTLSNQCNY